LNQGITLIEEHLLDGGQLLVNDHVRAVAVAVDHQASVPCVGDVDPEGGAVDCADFKLGFGGREIRAEE
jgi:hypothetical protein